MSVDVLIGSVVTSLVLTALLNVVIRLFPGTSASARAQAFAGNESEHRLDEPPPETGNRIHLFFPWKQILVWSAAITIFVNVVQFID